MIGLEVHAADQILVYLARAGRAASFTTRALSRHALSAMWLIEQLTPVRFGHRQEGAQVRVVTCVPGA